ncbi:MAG: hypothetical protein DI562_02055 [Stenotrophomonas acidaminiphila]|nr:MAG: hypothetical protein DI562_02055 [Stenotrophomonas acidaminiphila]
MVLRAQKVSGSSITGSCGVASVRISGALRDAAGAHVIGPDGAVAVRSGSRTLTVGPGPKGNAGVFLQDRNTLDCVDTPKGPKLLLTLYCDGRACAPMDYRVIDPNGAQILSTQDNLDECDTACAEKALGTSVPRE